MWRAKATEGGYREEERGRINEDRGKEREERGGGGGKGEREDELP